MNVLNLYLYNKKEQNLQLLPVVLGTENGVHSSGWKGVKADTRGCVGDGVTPGCPPAPLCMHGRALLIPACPSYLLSRHIPKLLALQWMSRGMFWYNCWSGEGSLTSANIFGQAGRCQRGSTGC